MVLDIVSLYINSSKVSKVELLWEMLTVQVDFLIEVLVMGLVVLMESHLVLMMDLV